MCIIPLHIYESLRIYKCRTLMLQLSWYVVQLCVGIQYTLLHCLEVWSALSPVRASPLDICSTMNNVYSKARLNHTLWLEAQEGQNVQSNNWMPDLLSITLSVLSLRINQQTIWPRQSGWNSAGCEVSSGACRERERSCRRPSPGGPQKQIHASSPLTSASITEVTEGHRC